MKKFFNFQAAITFEPIDVETSDKVFWASLMTYYKIPVEIPNRGGGPFPQGRKNQRLQSTYIIIGISNKILMFN